MSDKIFFEKQFEINNIPKGSGDDEDFKKCHYLIKKDSKLSSRRYNELLAIARDYCKV